MRELHIPEAVVLLMASMNEYVDDAEVVVDARDISGPVVAHELVRLSQSLRGPYPEIADFLVERADELNGDA